VAWLCYGASYKLSLLLLLLLLMFPIDVCIKFLFCNILPLLICMWNEPVCTRTRAQLRGNIDMVSCMSCIPWSSLASVKVFYFLSLGLSLLPCSSKHACILYLAFCQVTLFPCGQEICIINVIYLYYCCDYFRYFIN